MATGDIPTQNLDLAGLLNIFTGKNTNTSGSSTTKSNVTDADTLAIVQQALQGNNGLAAIANGQHAAGLYGGSSATLLTNNLLSDVASKVAIAQAGTTTTTAGNSKTDPALNPLKTGGALLGASLINQIIKGAGGGGIADLLAQGGKGIGSLIGQVTGSGSGGAAPVVDPNGEGVGNNTGQLTPQQIEQAASGQTTPAITPDNGASSDVGNGYGTSTTTIPISSLFPDIGNFNAGVDYSGGLNFNTSSSDEDENTPDLSSDGGNP